MPGISADSGSGTADTKTTKQVKKPADSSDTGAEHSYVQTAESDYDYIEYEDHIMLGTYKGTEQYIITPSEIMRAQGHEEPTGKAKITPGYNHNLCPPPLRVRVSCGHLCEAEAPTEATAETRST